MPIARARPPSSGDVRCVHTEIRGWTLADSIDDHEFATLLDAAQEQLSDLDADSGVAFDVSALVISGSTA